MSNPTTTPPAEFYLLSTKWTRGEHIVWWRPRSAGYTWASREHLRVNDNIYVRRLPMPDWLACATGAR